MSAARPIVVYLPDTRGVTLSRYGAGNAKLGFGVFTYSRLAGFGQTCPGATPECERVCYAKRIEGPVRDGYFRNAGPDVPPIPQECKLLRVHVSGDFDTIWYINCWIARLLERPDVTAWAYTRSWRVPELLLHLEKLRALPNVQLFASMDKSHADTPPAGWRRAWLDGDPRAGQIIDITAHGDVGSVQSSRTLDGVASYVCPEETGHKANCVECSYCFAGQRNDVTFLLHTGETK